MPTYVRRRAGVYVEGCRAPPLMPSSSYWSSKICRADCAERTLSSMPCVACRQMPSTAESCSRASPVPTHAARTAGGWDSEEATDALLSAATAGTGVAAARSCSGGAARHLPNLPQPGVGAAAPAYASRASAAAAVGCGRTSPAWRLQGGRSSALGRAKGGLMRPRRASKPHSGTQAALRGASERREPPDGPGRQWGGAVEPGQTARFHQLSCPMSAARRGCLHRRHSAATISGRPEATAHRKRSSMRTATYHVDMGACRRVSDVRVRASCAGIVRRRGRGRARGDGASEAP